MKSQQENVNQEYLDAREKERQKALRVLENSYAMYEDNKKTIPLGVKNKVDKFGNRLISDEKLEETMQLIDTCQKDIIDKYVDLGGTVEELKANSKGKKKNKKALNEYLQKQAEIASIAEYMQQLFPNQEGTNANEVVNNTPTPDFTPTQVPSEMFKTIHESMMEKPQNVAPKEMPNMEQSQGSMNKIFDLIELPSKGQCYRHKKDKIRVSYLTAYDENMILSPNLYKDGSFLSVLLKNKIMESDIDVENLTQGDRDAIVLWLRATGYGNEYPIIVTDDKTGKEFETVVDLSKLEYRPFNLVGDENGFFEYVVPSTQHVIKFKFLTIKDLKFLKEQSERETTYLNAQNILDLCDELGDAIRDNDLISINAQQKIRQALELSREEINANHNESMDVSFSHELTNRLLLQTISVNGVTDRKYIENYIYTMNVKDASQYRKFLLDNEPGVDFNIEVERPQSLGGGSIKSFLRLDQFIFINI